MSGREKSTEGDRMNDYIEHHGIKGMHWGIRRYQNPDGSLTAAGRKRYGYRQQDIARLNKENSSYKRDIADSKRELDDLNRNGINSRTFKKAYGDPNAVHEESFKEMYGYSSRREALNDLKNSIKQDIKFHNEWIESNSDAIENIRNTPLNEKSYTERVRAGDTAAKIAFATGAIGSVAVSALAGSKGLISGRLAVKSALVGIGSAAAVGLNIDAAAKDKAWKGVHQSRPAANQKEISKIESQLASNAQFMRKMEKLRESGATEHQIADEWNRELDRRIDRYLESKI